MALIIAWGCSAPPDPASRIMAAGPATVGKYIMVDQFGYRPDDPKVAVLVDPQQGFNAGDSYTPGSSIEVRRWSDDATVHTAQITQWNGGNTQASSGDRGWWLDFSAVNTPGSYYLYDPTNSLGSHRFEINEDVYREVLKAATRMFFYNRSGGAKKPPYTDARWEDDAAYLGPGQDTQGRSVNDKNNASTERDVRGGWFDAGDTNKYVTYAESVVHQLLTAYEENPGPFTDDFNIPESGNGIPDLLDEVKWEVDWIKRMQESDGGVLLKVGVLDHNAVAPPSQDARPRYYIPACSSSTIAAAGMLAHAALVYDGVSNLKGEVADLTQRAEKAWDWYQANPKQTDCDSQEIKAGDADRGLEDQEASSVVAAIYLFALTGDSKYDSHVTSNYTKTWPYKDNGWSRYEPHQGDALLYYTTLATADATVKTAILDKKTQEAQTEGDIYGKVALEQDLYRAFITDATYHWGSNNARACNGAANQDMLVHNLDAANAADYRARALGIVHYMHGVNPLGMVFLSNMVDYGAEVSANEIYHTWFADGSDWDNALTSPKGPAPGFVPGGPNKSFSGSTSPPAGQPAQKSYLDWNTGWPDSSWEVTEPGIYYQSAYVKLLSKLVGPPAATPGDGGPSPGDGATVSDGETGEAGTAGDAGSGDTGGSLAGDGDGGDRGDDGCSCAVGVPSRSAAAPVPVLLVLVLLALALARRSAEPPRR
jgi:hypothetical protein